MMGKTGHRQERCGGRSGGWLARVYPNSGGENEQKAGAGYKSSKPPSSDPLSPGSW